MKGFADAVETTRGRAITFQGDKEVLERLLNALVLGGLMSPDESKSFHPDIPKERTIACTVLVEDLAI